MEHAFKVELLKARALPWNLLRLATVFSSEDSSLRKAASNHFRHVEEHLQFLDEVDFSETLAEWEHWHDLYRRRFEPGIRHRLDAERFVFLGRQLERYMATYSHLNESFFSLVALGFFSAGLPRGQILKLLNGQSWATKHEVLARWGWMGKHRELLQAGHSPPAPYSCVVTLKDQDGRQADEEFDHLIVFLHLLRASYGEELLFAKKGDTPDFVLENEKGEPVGAEMTEVWISDEWAKEHDAASSVLKYIFGQLRHLPFDIYVQTPPSWASLSSHLHEVGEWLSSELACVATHQSKVLLDNNDLCLKIRLTPAEKNPYGVTWGSELASRRLDTEKNSQDLHESLRAGIERKITKKGKIRDKPTVRPCDLVIYPYHMLDADLESMLQAFFRSPRVDVSSHFDRVWLCDWQRLVRLF